MVVVCWCFLRYLEDRKSSFVFYWMFGQIITKMISTRAQKVIDSADFLVKWNKLANENKYDPLTNTSGVINLGMAENRLVEDIVSLKIEECLGAGVDPSSFHYFCSYGILSLRENISEFLNMFLKPKSLVDPQDLIVVCGTTSIFDILSIGLAESGDYFLCPAPYFSRIRNNMADKGNVLCYDVPMDMVKFEENSTYIATRLEMQYAKARDEGLNVKGIILINPDNPTGKVYSGEELESILKLCKRYNLHIIADEIYALSYFGTGEFRSILSMDDIPETVHFIWGLSKDFGLAGYRCGILQTKHKPLLEFARKVALYHSIPLSTQKVLTRFFEDKGWIETVFLPTYTERLCIAYSKAVKMLQQLGATVFKGSGGIYIWTYLGKFMTDITFEEETILFTRLFNGGVYCTPGKEFYCREPGWFRIVISLYNDHFHEGLRRLETILKKES